MRPDEIEFIFPPFTTLQIIAVERLETHPKTLVLARPHICSMRHYTDSLKYPWSSPNDPLTNEEYEQILSAGVLSCNNSQAVTIHKLSGM